MKATIKNCAYHKCQKPFRPNAGQKYCHPNCSDKAKRFLNTLRRTNIRNEEHLERC